jgi:Raf kinase inhibitor-like YbhB/YbcL family protein
MSGLKKIVTFLAMTLVVWAGGFTLESPDVSGQLSLVQVYNGFGCRGENLSPELHWRGEPMGTKSFAVTMYDPDAPTGSGWWHWIVCNIPKNIHDLPRGAGDPSGTKMPKGALQCLNDYGEMGYGGACPPRGDKPHRYILTVYALDVEKLPVDPHTPPAKVRFMIESHAVAKSSLMAWYGR